MHSSPFDPLFHLQSTSPAHLQASPPFSLAKKAVESLKIHEHESSAPSPSLVRNEYCFTLTGTPDQQFETALILQQALENLQVNQRIPIAAEAFLEEKHKRPEKDKADDELRHRVAANRANTAAVQLERSNSDLDALKNTPGERPETRSWKRVVTERNAALHAIRSDLAEHCQHYPEILPSEMEGIVADCRTAVKNSAFASYQSGNHELKTLLTPECQQLPVTVFTQRLQDELRALKIRLTMPTHELKPTPRMSSKAAAAPTMIQVSLNEGEAKLFSQLAKSYDIPVEQEAASIPKPDPNPLVLLNIARADFARFRKELGGAESAIAR